MRPDPKKVSSNSTLMNSLMVVLKLCEPFIGKEEKRHLIDAGYVSTPSAHGGVYATGEDGVPRLGEIDPETLPKEYNPKNSFIPQCFFLCARFIHLGYAPQFSMHENLLRHISHVHWEIQSDDARSLRTDETFMRLVAAQRSNEVALFQEELMTDTLRFCNLMSRFLFELDDETLRLMPEHFVNDTCDVIMSVAKMRAKALRGLEFRYVFKLVVKLLSPKYTGVSNDTLFILRSHALLFLCDKFYSWDRYFFIIDGPQLQSSCHARRRSL